MAVHFPAMYHHRRSVSDHPQSRDPVHAVRLCDEKHGRQDVPEAGGRRWRGHAAAGCHNGPGCDGRHRQYRRHLAGHRPRRLRCSVLAVAGGAARHDDQVFRGHAVHPIPRARRKGRLGRRPDVLRQKRSRQALAVGRHSVLRFRSHRFLRHRQYVAGQLHRRLPERRHRRLHPGCGRGAEAAELRVRRCDRRADRRDSLRRNQAHRRRGGKARSGHERFVHHFCACRDFRSRR